MNRILILLIFSSTLLGCKSANFVDTEKFTCAWNVAPDGSASKLSDKEANAIAKAIVSKREQWPETYRDKNGLIHIVLYGARRIDNGCWRVIAHKSCYSDSPTGCGDPVFDADPAAIIIINERGKVISYKKRFTSDW